jgi:hypothetical protein
MNALNLPEPKQTLLNELTARLIDIPGLAALALGGSYAGGTAHADSDLDLGLYYKEEKPLDLEAVRTLASAFSTQSPATVTGFYEWGAWVNGGAWIHTPVSKVDFLYRNIEQVQRTLREARQGVFQHDYDQQPTHGFYSVIYLAETSICVPLYDPQGMLSDLKQQVAVYPPLLKQRILSDCLWAAEFTLLHAHNFAAQADVYNTAGCLSRAAANLNQALFALNERYFLRDKQIMPTIAGFSRLPEEYAARLSQILACPGADAPALSRAVHSLQELWQAVVDLTGGFYQPKFRL